MLSFPQEAQAGHEGFPPEKRFPAGSEDAVGVAMGGARGGRARPGLAAQGGERGAGGFAPGAHGCPRRDRGSSYRSSPGARGDGERAGKGRTRRLSHAGTAWRWRKAAKRRGLQRGTGVDGASQRSRERRSRQAAGGGRSPSRYWRKVAELLAAPAPSEAPCGVPKLPGAWGALGGSRGMPGFGATARGEAACESRLGGPGGVCEA